MKKSAKTSPSPKVWCVRHRKGWCAIKDGKKPEEDGGNVPTLCDHHVILNFGVELRRPDCPDCIQAASAPQGQTADSPTKAAATPARPR